MIQRSQTMPARLPSGAIKKASPSSHGSAPKSVTLPRLKPFGSDIVKDDEPMIDRRTYEAGDERWLSRRCALRVGVNSYRVARANKSHRPISKGVGCHRRRKRFVRFATYGLRCFVRWGAGFCNRWALLEFDPFRTSRPEGSEKLEDETPSRAEAMAALRL